MANYITGRFEEYGKKIIYWKLFLSGNEPKLWLKFEDTDGTDLEVPKVLRHQDDMSPEYLNSEDTEYGIFRFAEITGIPYEFLNKLRRGLFDIV